MFLGPKLTLAVYQLVPSSVPFLCQMTFRLHALRARASADVQSVVTPLLSAAATLLLLLLLYMTTSSIHLINGDVSLLESHFPMLLQAASCWQQTGRLYVTNIPAKR
jgi:hypothetical protein